MAGKDLGLRRALAWRCQLRERGNRTVKEHNFNFLRSYQFLLYQSYNSLYHFLPSSLSDLSTSSHHFLLTDSFQTPFTFPKRSPILCRGACYPLPVSTQTNPTPPITAHLYAMRCFNGLPVPPLGSLPARRKCFFYGCEKTRSRPWNLNVVYAWWRAVLITIIECS